MSLEQGPNLEQKLETSVSHLIQEAFSDSPQQARRYLAAAAHGGTTHQLEILRALLCERPAIPELPEDVAQNIGAILSFLQRRKVLTPALEIPTRHEISRGPNHSKPPIKLSVWRGDITTLTDIVAIVNAANSQLLGCFQPQHRCIDNVIHSAAGPMLRAECNRIMAEQKHPEPVGKAKATPGYNLPAKNQSPTEQEKQSLANCYVSCLNQLETLPSLEDGTLNIAFCCISTGLFAFPAKLAAEIAVKTVVEWCKTHPDTPVTHVLFDTFTEDDFEYYTDIFTAMSPSAIFPIVLEISVRAPDVLSTAKRFIDEADYLIISAGAGLSAADGLDYTSKALFTRRYAAFRKYGLGRLYDTIGFDEWPSLLEKWGFFVSHAETIRQWPKSKIYASLLELASRFQDRYFVRTTNADGLFLANSFPAEKIATPQGQYKYLQCYAKCRPDAYFPFVDFIQTILPFIDPQTGALTDSSLIPTCKYCWGELTLCVRGGSYFNETPFKRQEAAWYKYLRDIKDDPSKKAVILELGVGMNTPGVLRWPNEDLARGHGGRFKLIRAGLGPSSCVQFDMEADTSAVGIDGDINDIINLLSR